MIGFHHIFRQDYDKRLFLGGEHVFGYSKKRMRELYPEKSYTVVGKAKSGGLKKKKPSEKQRKKEEKRIGKLHVNGKELDVYPVGEKKELLQKREGFVCVGEDKYVAIQSNLLPFLLAVIGLALMIALVAVTLVWLLGREKPPVTVDPDHPLPEVDPDVEPIPDDTDEKANSENGGGFVSLVYTKDASVSLSTGKATIYYQNPNKSNHSVLLEFYLISNEQEYFLGKTGLIPAGSAIYQLDVTDRDVSIRAGTYTGLYRTYYYDPITGERAAISSDITEIVVTVTE